MNIDTDEARTDVILAAATAVFGGSVRVIVGQLPGYPRQGMAALVVDLAWILVLTALVPVLLARHRGDGAAAFALTAPRRGLSFGFILAVPVVAAQLLLGALIGVAPGRWLAARFGGVMLAPSGAPALAAAGRLVVLTVGALLLVTFLSRRGQQGFTRSSPVPLLQMVRTVGIGAAAVALVAGMLRSLTGPAPLPVLLNVTALVAVLLVVDRRVPATARVQRAAVLAPVIVVALLHVFATGGLFRGDLVTALYAGALGAGIAVAVTTVSQMRAIAWAGVPLLLAVHWWPSCLSPLAFELAVAC